MGSTRRLIVLACLLLSGCTTVQEFENMREAVKGDPALRREKIEKCARDIRLTPKDRRMGAALLNIGPDGDVERTACKRMVAGLVSGRLTYEAVFSRPIRLTPELIRVLQNR